MKPQPNFDRVASIYRWAEYLSLGPLLQRVRTHFLPQLQNNRHALLLGDGDGRFLARLLEQNPALEATAVDTSARMLALLRQRCAPAAWRLKTLQASALEVTPSPDTDLIVTHFFLDCLTQSELETMTRTYASALRPGTLWLVSDFALPRSPLLRPFGAAYIRTLYFAFRVLTGLRVHRLPDTTTALQAAGFHKLDRRDYLNGLLYTELWQLQ